MCEICCEYSFVPRFVDPFEYDINEYMEAVNKKLLDHGVPEGCLIGRCLAQGYMALNYTVDMAYHDVHDEHNEGHRDDYAY
jgi:hypothetical protein